MNYSATDKEALAIFYGVKRFQHYLLGRRFILQTDHKPLTSIFSRKTGIPAMAAGRLQRWSVFLSNFDFHIEYIKGTENVNADFLSRFPVDEPVAEEAKEANYLNFIATRKNKVVDANAIRIESRRDLIISKVMECVRYEWSDSLTKDENYIPFASKRNELSIEQDVLMWGYRVIIPSKLRQRLLNDLHSTHLGVVKMKSRARPCFWWPSLDKDIENLCRSCQVCKMNAPDPAKSKISPWQLTTYPYQRIHIDFLGPFKDKYYFAILDSFSKWVEIYKMTNISAKETVSKLRDCFARFGLPELIVSDNGTQFTSSEFKEFCDRNSIKHLTSATYNAVRSTK